MSVLTHALTTLPRIPNWDSSFLLLVKFQRRIKFWQGSVPNTGMDFKLQSKWSDWSKLLLSLWPLVNLWFYKLCWCQSVLIDKLRPCLYPTNPNITKNLEFNGQEYRGDKSKGRVLLGFGFGCSFYISLKSHISFFTRKIFGYCLQTCL